jgi:hypothetical protein
MKKSDLEIKRDKLKTIINSLTTLEELRKVEVILNFVLFAKKKDQLLLEKLMESDAFDPEQMIAFMKGKLIGNKRARSREVVA